MLGSGLWAATILDRILAAVGSPFGIDTSGMSSLAAAAAVAFAIYSWYSKIKPKPGPTPTPEPQPSPTPQPLPSPTPSPSPQPVDIGQLLQVLLPELAKVFDGLLKKRLAEVPQLGPETIVDDADEGLEVFGATGPASRRGDGSARSPAARSPARAAPCRCWSSPARPARRPRRRGRVRPPAHRGR